MGPSNDNSCSFASFDERDRKIKESENASARSGFSYRERSPPVLACLQKMLRIGKKGRV